MECAWSDLEKRWVIDTICIIELKTLEESQTIRNTLDLEKSTQRFQSVLSKASTHQDNQNETESGLFVCPKEGCVKEFISFGGLEKHLLTGEHHFRTRSAVPLSDIVKRKWASKFDSISVECTEAHLPKMAQL